MRVVLGQSETGLSNRSADGCPTWWGKRVSHAAVERGGETAASDVQGGPRANCPKCSGEVREEGV